MRKLFRILFVCLFMFLGFVVNGQTFIVEDCQTFNTSSKEEQRLKKEALGATVQLTFYKNDVKVTIYKTNGRKETDIFSKVNDNLYRYMSSNTSGDYADLELSRIIAYISSCRFSIYENGVLCAILDLKRD